MDSKEFIKALRTLIREEVRAAVREEMKVLTENKQPSKTKTKLKVEDIWESMGSTAKTTRSTVAHTTTSKKSFVKDPLLNDLLNDTASRPIQLTEGYDTIGTYSAEMAQGFGMMRGADPTKPTVAPIHDLDGRPVNMDNEGVANVVSAMTKDYSALMKAIDKKKGKI